MSGKKKKNEGSETEEKVTFNMRIAKTLRNRIKSRAHQKEMPMTQFMIWLFEEYDKRQKKS